MRKLTLEDGSVRFEVNGALLTEEEFDKAFFDGNRGEPGAGLIQWHKPVESDALAVHPKQIKEAMERDKRHGLNIEYKPDGRPVFKSEHQMRQMMKSLGLHRNNCYM